MKTNTNISASSEVTVPTTMKAVQVHEFASDFGPKESTKISMETDVAKPSKLNKNQLLVRVLACSISPGDVLMVRGSLIFMQPENGFPFTPGMDICGLVEDPNGDSTFSKGDIVVASNGMSPEGGLAEYMAVPKEECVLKPTNVTVLEGAASSSSITARNAVLDHVQKGQRVLILGGSGGVGSAAIQLAKAHANASFVATTSSQADFCRWLGADRVIAYRTENWWELEEFHKEKFDVIIDTVGGGNFVDKAERVLKTGHEGGKFIAVAGDDSKPNLDTWWKAVKFFANLPLRPLYTWMNSRKLPSYTLLMPYDIPKGRKQVLEMMDQKTLRVPLDERSSPLRFTQEGVQKAFEIVASSHAHGKVVVSMEEGLLSKSR